MQSACRPGSVQHLAMPVRPSIWDRSYLQPLATYPGIDERAARSPVGVAPSGVCIAASVTRDAGALLPHRFTLTFAGGLLSVALSTGRPAWELPSTLPYGARTFLDTLTGTAAARPTASQVCPCLPLGDSLSR